MALLGSGAGGGAGRHHGTRGRYGGGAGRHMPDNPANRGMGGQGGVAGYVGAGNQPAPPRGFPRPRNRIDEKTPKPERLGAVARGMGWGRKRKSPARGGASHSRGAGAITNRPAYRPNHQPVPRLRLRQALPAPRPDSRACPHRLALAPMHQRLTRSKPPAWLWL